MSRPLYLHEVIDVVGRGAAPYMAHVVGFDDEAVADRGLALVGTWEVVGATGRWPQVVNLWELRDGLAGWERLTRRTNVAKAANDELAEWWDEAHRHRSGGFDRLLVGARGAPDAGAEAAAGRRGELAVHELSTVRPGAGPEYLAAVVEGWAPLAAERGVHLVGAYEVLMTDVEVVTVWVTDVAAHAALLGAGVDGDAELARWAVQRREWCTAWREELMTPGAGSPFAPG